MTRRAVVDEKGFGENSNERRAMLVTGWRSVGIRDAKRKSTQGIFLSDRHARGPMVRAKWVRMSCSDSRRDAGCLRFDKTLVLKGETEADCRRFEIEYGENDNAREGWSGGSNRIGGRRLTAGQGRSNKPPADYPALVASFVNGTFQLWWREAPAGNASSVSWCPKPE